jgi:hypothetical protein
LGAYTVCMLQALLRKVVSPILDHLKPKLPDPDHAFLTALVAVLNDRTKLPELEKFPVWRDAKPLPSE